MMFYFIIPFIIGVCVGFGFEAHKQAFKEDVKKLFEDGNS